MRVVHIVGIGQGNANATIVALLQSQGCLTIIVPTKEPKAPNNGVNPKAQSRKHNQAEATQPNDDCYANPLVNQKTDLIKN
jgi:hypothetical protein